MASEQSSATASAGPRSASYQVRVVHDVRIPTAEPGITLGANVYLPITAVPVPAVTTILHNSKDGIAGIGGAPYLEYFARRGYASVLVDRLGTGTSDGIERPAFDPGDGDDGVAVVEWSANQPWCNGRVGMWGLSYGAINTLRTASRRPPHLRAIVPIMGLLDPEREFVHPSGERGAMSYFGLAGVWNLFIQLQPPMVPDPDGRATRRWEERLRNFQPWLLDAWRHRPGDPRWRERVIDASRIVAPTFCIAGWHDIFLAGTVRAYEQVRAPKRLMIGPWMHELPNEAPREPVDCIALACDWWERWLVDEPARGRGPSTPDEKGPVLIYLGGARPSWRRFPTWPPPRRLLSFAATEDHRLRREPDGCSTAGGQARPRWLRRAGDRTVGAMSGLGAVPLAGFGFPLDQHDDDIRSLMFTSEPLPEPLVLAGTVTVEVALGPGTTASRCIAKLTDVDPQGRSSLITAGVGRIGLQPSVDRSASITLNPAGYELAPGHRLRLVLSDSDLPSLWPASGGAVLDVAVRAGGDGESEFGTRAARVTSVTVPVCEPMDDYQPPRPPLTPPPFTGRPPRRTWRITRDHAVGQVSVTVGDAASASIVVGKNEIQLEREVEVTLRVNGEPTAASLTGTGVLTLTNGAGDRTVVTARTRVREDGVAAVGEVLINDVVVVSRRWSS